MRIVTLSDTHCRLRKVNVPSGDLLLHAGDLTFKGDYQEINQELRELGRIAKNFKHGCILVPGNHDWLFDKQWALAKKMCEDEGITVLHHESTQIEGLNIFGSAYTPEFCNWAFNVPRGQALKDKWAQIPDNTDILITHGPPMGILDNVSKFNHATGEMIVEHVGCLDLYNRIQELPKLRLQVFGHLHDGYGHIEIKGVDYLNASICTEDYKPINLPQTISI
jgi:Icc-related predicted phosphoesterase